MWRQAVGMVRTALSVPALVRVAEGTAALRKSPVLAPSAIVSRWMAMPSVVDQNLGFFGRNALFMNLRLLRGLDVENFLLGSRQAYSVVQELLSTRQWGDLQPMMHPEALSCLQKRLPDGQAVGDRLVPENIHIRRAVLARAEILEDDPEVAAGTCHLFVRFEALQSYTMHDLLRAADGVAELRDPKLQPPRLQESTWTFEGIVGDDPEVDPCWRVIDIEWKVWEVDEERSLPSWPTHGP